MYYVATAAAAFVCLHFYTLPDTRVLSSFEELCIMRVAAENSITRALNPHVIHRQTVSLYHNSSVWLDT